MKASLRDSYLAYRDTLRTIDASTALLLRDIRGRSDALVLSRARAVASACAASRRGLEPTRSAMLESPAVADARPATRQRVADRFAELAVALDACIRDFSPVRSIADVPGFLDRGPAPAVTARDASNQLERAAEVLLKSLHIDIRPFGAGPSPFASESR